MCCINIIYCVYTVRELSADHFTHRPNILCSCSFFFSSPHVCVCVCVLVLFFLFSGSPYVTHRSMQTIFHHTNAFEICLTKIEHCHGIFNIHFNRSHAMTPNGPTAFVTVHIALWLWIEYECVDCVWRNYIKHLSC